MQIRDIKRGVERDRRRESEKILRQKQGKTQRDGAIQKESQREIRLFRMRDRETERHRERG